MSEYLKVISRHKSPENDKLRRHLYFGLYLGIINIDTIQLYGFFVCGIIDLLTALITGNTVLFLGPEQQKDKTFFIDKEVNIIFYIDENRRIICPINTCIKPVIIHTLMLSCTISHGK